ncbi:type I glutamate--ammonia ligase [Streptomyces xylophagus]|uniref:hypothetical protein n=1 Tax=Streptomyces xylophagus TaxID=285514 RepID=UPI000691B9CC|nr:hypothetical protein [Streptomyces xylophagus]
MSQTPNQPEDAAFELLRDLVDRRMVDTVLLAVPDMLGRLKGKRIDADHFVDRVVAGGGDICAYILATDVDMRALDGFALASADTGYGDVSLLPDPDAVYRLAWMRRTALVFADAIGHDGQPVSVAPRQILQRQLDRLAARGITAQVGLETEFVLSYADATVPHHHPLRPVFDRNLDYSLDHPQVLTRFFEELQGGLGSRRGPSPNGPGWWRTSWPHPRPASAAVPGTFAPTTFTWGRDNRTCAIRVVGRGENLHLENRLPGADTNPYLALAATLAAVLVGLDHKSEPPQPYVGSAFDDPEAPPVLGSLQEALDALPNCPLPAEDLLTADVAAHYATAAGHELDVHRITVTDFDLLRGLTSA